MTTKTINPLMTLSIQDLRELIIGIEKNFMKVESIDIVQNIDYSKHFDKYQDFIKYLITNKVVIKQGDKTLNLSYGEMASILISAELRDRILPKN
jgi:hypothetical protein